MQSNWAALQTKIKGKGAKAPRPEKRVKPDASASREDARETKKRKKHARRRANDDGTSPRTTARGDVAKTSETRPSRPSVKANHETRSRSEPARASGDAAPLSAPPRPPDDGSILDDTSPLAPERRRALFAASAIGVVSGSPDLEDLRAAPVEAARLEAVSHLCFAFEKTAAHLLGANRWANAFEELMLRRDDDEDGENGDPLLPTDDAARAFCAARFARRDPTRSDTANEVVCSDAIERATESVVAAVRRARDAVARAAARAAEAPARDAARVQVERLDPPAANDKQTPREDADASGSFRSIRAKVPAPARVRLRLGQAKVELRAEHFQKLARLWRSRRRAAGWDSETVDATSDVSVAKKSDDACYGDNRFLRAAFACSARVVAAQGGMHRVAGGHHAALHGAVFDVLKYGPLRVEAELFASPLNCRYDVFCSAHADVDAPFGSLGSFFAFEPKDGSFEVNPPFESDVVLAVARRLERLLKDAEARNDALSFTVITPYWPKRAAWEALNKSAFRTRAPVVVAARDHFYVDGAQHCKRKTHKPASCDTSVLFLQTSRGREKYVATDETVEALRAAFRPTR